LTQGKFHARIRGMSKLNLRARVKPYLADLKSRATTNRAVAAELGVNEQSLCRVLAELEFEKEPAVDRTLATKLHRERQAFRTQCAATMTPEDAAKACNVSLRTIYRYMKKAG
jgi:DNA-directed RNA polymerase specialized sigma24 family protein